MPTSNIKNNFALVEKQQISNIQKEKVEEVITYIVVAVGSSGILKGKQKLGVTFNSDKLGAIDFTNFSKLTMCSA